MEGKSIFSASFDIFLFLQSIITGKERYEFVTPDDDSERGPITYIIKVSGLTKTGENSFSFTGTRVNAYCSAGGWGEAFECSGTFEYDYSKTKATGFVEFGKSLGWPE